VDSVSVHREASCLPSSIHKKVRVKQCYGWWEKVAAPLLRDDVANVRACSRYQTVNCRRSCHNKGAQVASREPFLHWWLLLFNSRISLLDCLDCSRICGPPSLLNNQFRLCKGSLGFYRYHAPAFGFHQKQRKNTVTLRL
jgi:hypothetical protein